MTPVNAFCTRCKASVPVTNPKAVTLKNGRPAVTGGCVHCQTQTFKFVKMSRGG